MSERLGPGRRLWRALLRTLYGFRDSILKNPVNLERLHSFFSRFPIQNNKVLMDNFYGNGYGENPKYITEELLKSHTGLKIVWLVNDVHARVPKGVTLVSRYSLRAHYESATAKAWVFNTRSGKLTKKRKQQIYLQTWHGSLALKMVEKDAEGSLPETYITAAQEDGRICDGILVDGQPNESLFTTSFWLGDQCELLRYGSPRVDTLIKNRDNVELKENIRRQLGIDSETYLVLYAPTFRDDSSTDGYISDFDSILGAFESRYGKTTLAIRLHPNAANLIKSMPWEKNGKTVDTTFYPDVQELVLAADCLITDYSSIAYDFTLLHKPVLCCAKDLDEYKSGRGVYPIFYEQPFEITTDERALANAIVRFDEETYSGQLDAFYQKHPTYNRGTAAKQAAEWLFKKGLGSK